MSDILNRITPLAAIMALVAIASPTAADFYQFTFGGEIIVVNGFVPEPWETVQVGSEFEYNYIFDSEAEDQSGIPWYGVYDLMWAQVTIEGVAQATEEGGIFVWNGDLDEYTAYFSDLPIGASGDVMLTGYDDVIDSDDLLLDVNLDEWVLSQGFEVIGQGYSIYGTVTSFEAQIVPAPSALSVVLAVGLMVRRRHQRYRTL